MNQTARLGLLAVFVALAATFGAPAGAVTAAGTLISPTQLTRGCNQIVATSATGTPIVNIAKLVNPTASVISIWRFNNGTKQYQAGFFSDPLAPTDFVTAGGITTANVGNLPGGTVTTPIVGGGAAVVNTGAQILEAYFICVSQSATIGSG